MRNAALWMAAVALASAALTVGVVRRRRRPPRRIDLGSVSANWLAHSSLERDE